MGRKKIDIKLIEDKKDRQVTFAKRKIGLLKKAAELAILCGTKVSLLFTDLSDQLHTYSNTDDVRLLVSSRYSSEIHPRCWINYTEADVNC